MDICCLEAPNIYYENVAGKVKRAIKRSSTDDSQKARTDLMQNTLPIVTVATACERTLLEQDGVISLIRIVDQYTISMHTTGTIIPPDKVPEVDVPVEVNIFICLKSGDFHGAGELSLKLHLPHGEIRDFPEKWPLLMKGAEHGVNVRLKLGLSSKHIGLSWIEIYWDAQYLAKFPIKLMKGEDTVEIQSGTNS